MRSETYKWYSMECPGCHYRFTVVTKEGRSERERCPVCDRTGAWEEFEKEEQID